MGTVTLLFTDIEGSTRTWEEHPADMAAALARHDALLTAAIEDGGGRVFKTVGDAFCAIFGDAADGARAAVAAQRALAAEPWPGTMAIQVRMAMHSGVCEERAGDYFGPTVNRVARLLSIAHGAQTIVSGSTAKLLAGRLPSGITLRDLGEHRLKDLARPERVFQLDADELPASFPPLRSLGETPRHNLPEQLTSFVGRERETAEVAKLVGSSALVTLTGAGGTGKTRVALRVAAEQLDAWRDGVWLVDLASITQSDSVATQIGAVLQVREQTGRAFLDTLVESVRDRQLLLVLDSCEHVIDGAATVVDALLQSSPDLAVLATSRESLGVRGENVYRISSLAVPDADETALERIAGTEAVRLLVDRMAQDDAEITVDRSNAATLVRVCRRLDGIPLAIELAAARLRTMTLDELDQGLDQRFRLLAGGPRRARERHQTLRATVDWSYDLLTPQEQRFFDRLSVFSGGFDLDGAEAVCGGEELDRWDVLDLLTLLVDKSLVQADHETAAVRFALLETMRTYAGDRLAEEGADAVALARRSHRDHYVLLAEGLAPELDGPDGAAAMDRLELDYGNLRAALLTSLDDSDPEPGLRLAVALRHLWKMRGPVLESVELLTELLELPDGADAMLRGRALVAAGSLQMELARLAAATTNLEAAAAVAADCDDPLLAATAFGHLAFIAYLQRDVPAAFDRSEQALGLARRSADPTAVATALMRRADAFDVAGDSEQCAQLIDEAITILRTTTNQRMLSIALFNGSEVAMTVEDLPAARRYLEEAVVLAEDSGNTHLLPHLQVGLGTVLALEGEPGAARARLSAGLVDAQRVGAPFLVANAVLMQAVAASLEGDAAAGALLHGAADRVAADLSVPFEPLQSRLRAEDRDRLRRALGDADFAAQYERGRTLTRAQAVELALEER